MGSGGFILYRVPSVYDRRTQVIDPRYPEIIRTTTVREWTSFEDTPKAEDDRGRATRKRATRKRATRNLINLNDITCPVEDIRVVAIVAVGLVRKRRAISTIRINIRQSGAIAYAD